MDGRGVRPIRDEKTFANRLKKAAYTRDISLQKLSEITGIHYSTLINQNRKVTLNAYNLIQICKALNCSADYLLFGKGTKNVTIFKDETKEELERRQYGHKKNQ